MFRDRTEAARLLAARLTGRALERPVVLGIPRGGMVLAAELAGELGADLDVVLARKLRAPHQPELAIGAVAEDGRVSLNEVANLLPDLTPSYLLTERRRQIRRRKELFRTVRPLASLAGRSVIVTDDGIATGATMLAALQSVRAQEPKELIVAVPVAAPQQLAPIRKACDELICLSMPERFNAVGQYYRNFRQVEDDEVVELLRSAAKRESERVGE
jgi:predicted phosphoribosyltransferase